MSLWPKHARFLEIVLSVKISVCVHRALIANYVECICNNQIKQLYGFFVSLL